MEEPGKLERSLWNYGESDVIVNVPSMMNIWQSFNKGIMPVDGGWLDQPLRILSYMEAIDLVMTTETFLKSKEPDLSKLTPTQHELIGWLNDET